VPKQTFIDNLPSAISLTIAVLVVAAVSKISWDTSQAQLMQQELNSASSKTEAGKFAVENFTACKHVGGPFSAAPSDAHCATETITGAEKLKGPGFASEVTRDLIAWREQSARLQSQ
jgi:hypothetical protein